MSQLLATPRTDVMTSETVPTLLNRLRQATREQHVRCEAVIDITAMASSLDAYGDALTCFQRLQEFVIAHTADVVADAPRQLGAGLHRGRARIAADLAALGRTPPGAGTQSVHGEPAELDGELSELGAQLGAWYVLEGSALGGTVIARHLAQGLVSAAGALSFFRGEGGGTARRWQQFRAFANELEAGGAIDFSGVLRGAERTFDHFLAVPARS